MKVMKKEEMEMRTKCKAQIPVFFFDKQLQYQLR